MPGNVGIQVRGATEVRKALRQVGAGTRNMTAVHRAIAQGLLPQVAMRARHGQTGKLAGSFRVRASAAKASIGSGLVYAPVQEYGWPRRHITPSLALTDTVQAAGSEILAQYTRAVADVIARAEADAGTPT
jgi:hypothetical protein